MITFPDIDIILSNRNSLSFTMGEGVDADVEIRFSDGSGTWVSVWEESYHTINGKVTIYGIGELLRDCLAGCIVGQVEIVAQERDYGTVISSSAKTFNAMLCECDEAADAVGDGWLTMFRGIKTTFVGAREDAYFYKTGDASCTVLAEYLRDDSSIELVETTPEEATMAGVGAAVKRIDMSPANYVASGKTLVHLTLQVEDDSGVRSMEWRVTEQEPTTRMMFRNSFGLPEVMCFYGAETRDIEHERSSAIMDGYNRNYRVQDKTKHTADTGIMTQGMAMLAEDLMRTEECYLLDDSNGIRREIRITGGKAKRTSEDTEAPRFEIEYENARLQCRSRGNDYSAARIFDDSFDLKFN